MYEHEFFDPSFGEMMDLIRQYEEAAKSNTKPYFNEESYEKIIYFYQDNREFKRAGQVIDAAIEQFPFTGEFLLKKAEVLAEQNLLDEALVVLDKAEQLDPSDVGVALTRADILLFKNDHEAALEEIDRGLALATEDEDKCELYLEMADVYEDKELYWEVIESLQQALNYEPDNEEAMSRLWFATEITEKYDESIVFHKQLIERVPYSHLSWFNLGHAYAGKQMWDEALDAFEYTIAIKEDFESGYICLGDVKFMQEAYEDALNFYHDALKIAKPNKELYLKTAECYDKLGDMPKARNYIRKSIAADPHYDEAFFLLGETYRKDENWAQAISAYQRAIKLNKENTDYQLALADAYLNIEDLDKAIELFEQVLDADPKQKSNWVNLAAANFEKGDYKAAFVLLNDAEKKFEAEADILYIKSVFYYQAGNKHEAVLTLEKALMLDFDAHNMIFELDENLQKDEAILQVIEQYRN